MPFQPLPVQSFRRGEGFRAAGVRGQPEWLDPVLMADLFQMAEPVFGPHPHAGFSAITYLFERSETGFRNRDAMGNDLAIRPGALHWTLAGSGTQHDEYPLQTGRWAYGLQLFVKLPAAIELQSPQALHLEPEEMPRPNLGNGVHAKLVFGHYENERAPIALPQDVSLVDVQLQPGRSGKLNIPAGQNLLLIGVLGEVSVQGVETLSASQALAAGSNGGALEIQAGVEPSQLLVLYGEPLHEPVRQHGPFALSSAERLASAIERFRQGGMGHLASA